MGSFKVLKDLIDKHGFDNLLKDIMWYLESENGKNTFYEVLDIMTLRNNVQHLVETRLDEISDKIEENKPDQIIDEDEIQTSSTITI